MPHFPKIQNKWKRKKWAEIQNLQFTKQNDGKRMGGGVGVRAGFKTTPN